MEAQLKNAITKILDHPAMLLAYKNRPWCKNFTSELDDNIKNARWLFSNPNVKNENHLGNINNGKHPYLKKIDSIVDFIIYIATKAEIDPLRTIKSKEYGGCRWE